MITKRSLQCSGSSQLAAVFCVISFLPIASAQVAELEISSDATISTEVSYSGEGFITGTPNSSAGHRNAVVVINDATLTLGDGADLRLENNDDHTTSLRVGYYNVNTPLAGAGSLTILSGAALHVGDLSRHATMHVGEGEGNTGVVTQSGGDVTVLGSFNVGVDGGGGSYTISGGTLNIDHADDAGHTSLANIGLNQNSVGEDAGTSSGTIVINGGTVNVLAHEWDPIGHSGEYGSTRLILGNRISGAEGNGTITQTDGVLHIDNHADFYLSAYGNGEYNLNGGTLEIGGSSLHAQYNSGPGTYAFNLGGGTIQVTGSDLTTSVDIALGAGTTSTIDTNGLNATLSGDITSDGLHQIDFGGSSLIKTGDGALTLSGSATRTLDTFAVTGGSAGQTAGDTSAVEFMAGTGSGNTGSYIMDGGTLTIMPSTRADNTTVVAGSFRIGDFGGTGTFTQNGGTVTLADNSGFNIGNQGGDGTYNLNGGTLNLNAGLHVLGRSTAGKSASTGVLNITDGLLVLDNDARLILGNNTNAVGTALGTGEVNQSGGIVRVTDGTLYVAGFGDGTYNFSGGTIEVGGTGLRSHYNSQSASSVFNFGNGTIKVIGENLSTDVIATLVDGTTATVDTNGFDAGFTAPITGTGALSKTGEGKLTISGTNSIGTLAVLGGSATNGTGTTTTGVLVVGSNSGDAASYDLTAGTLNLLVDGSRAEMTVGGGDGYSGVFNLSGGTLNVGDEEDFGYFFVGAYDGTGVANQTGGTLNATGSFQLGNRGGNGTYNLSAGLLNVGQYPADADSNAFILGRSRTVGQDNQSVGYLNVSGTGLLVLNTNTPLLIGGDYGSDASLSSGYVSQTGGTITVNSKIDIGSAGHGEYSLTGGTLEIGGSNTLVSHADDYVFNLGGGAIKVFGSDLSTELRATLVDGTVSTLNTNGFNATFTNGFAGTGGFAKTGTGALTLNGITDLQAASTVSGLLRVGAGSGEEGTLNLTNDLTVFITDAVGRLQVGVDGGTGTVNFNTGASFTIDDSEAETGWGTLDVGRGVGSIGVVNHSSGLVDISDGALQIAYSGATGTYNLSDDAELTLGGSSSTLFIGSGAGAAGLLTIADSSVFSSAGQVFVGAGTGATGTITQTGGSATFSGPTVWFGTDSDETTDAPGTGVYNLSGGTLVFDGVTQGVRFGDNASGGSGVFNQTGGTATFTNTTLKVGSNGAYNQSGGVLEVGGNNLTGSGVYTLGGGTIKVVGTALTTGMNATLNAEKNVVIDTNGLGATLSGDLTGDGGLIKTGEGELLVTGESDYFGATTIEAGTYRVEGILTNTTVTVQSGAVFSGHGTVKNLNILDGAQLFLDGTTGALTVTGDLDLAATSSTLLQITDATHFDSLVVDGALFADGTLEVQFTASFTASLGESYHLINGTINGTFSSVNLPSLGGGLMWDTTSLYSDGELSVIASAVPEPSSWAQIAGGAVLLVTLVRRRRRASAVV